MGWRETLALEPSRKDRKNRKDDAAPYNCLSGISYLPGGAPDPATEVCRLIEAIAKVSPYWTRQDVAETVQIAQGDRGNALMTYRELAKQYGATVH